MRKKYLSLFDGEETLEDCKKENTTRIKILKQGGKKALALARKLMRCKSRKRCRSPACAICNWFSRRKHVRKFRRFLKEYAEIYFVTLAPTMLFMASNALMQVNLRQSKNSLTKRINRSGLEDAIVLGGLEATYKFDLRRVSLHMHLIYANCSREELEGLRHHYSNRTENIREMRVDHIRKSSERTKVISYIFKNRTYGTVKKSRKKKRPPNTIEIHHLLFLDRHSFRNLMFLKGTRFYGENLVVISP